MFSDAKLHVMYQIANAAFREFPFPHIYVKDVFPPSFFEKIREQLPSNEQYMRLVDTGRVGMGYSTARLSLFPEKLPESGLSDGQQKFWEGMFATFGGNEFSSLVFQKFRPYIERRFTKSHPGGVTLNPKPEVFLMRDLQTYSLGPHTDSPAKLVSMLFYLPADDSRPELGTAVYVPKDRAFTCPGGPHHVREKFDHMMTLPYARNALVAFPKTLNCFHGVEVLTNADSQRDIFFFDLKSKS
jgi:hypothetical protein